MYDYFNATVKYKDDTESTLRSYRVHIEGVLMPFWVKSDNAYHALKQILNERYPNGWCAQVASKTVIHRTNTVFLEYACIALS